MQSNYERVKRVLNLYHDCLGLKVGESDISFAHRIPCRKKDKHRPIIVRLSSCRVKNSILAARSSLRVSSARPDSALICINEHLTKKNAHIYARTRNMLRKKKILATGESSGSVFSFDVPTLLKINPRKSSS